MVNLKDILGGVANWGTQQSPYTCPENLTEAIIALNKHILANCKSINYSCGFPVVELSPSEIYDMLIEYFEQIPEIMLWNTPKNRQDNVKRYVNKNGAPNPDDDFIDLHALARNVTHDIETLEAVRENWQEVVEIIRKPKKTSEII